MALSLVRKTLLLAKTEAVPGTAESSLSATTDTMLLFGSGSIIQMDQKMIDKAALRASLTPQKQLVGRRLYNINAGTVLMGKGAGGATGYPWFAPMLKACGLAEAGAGTVTSGQTGSWTYTPVSSAFQSATLWIYKDGILHKAGANLGTFTLDLKAGEAPDLMFDLQGTLAAEPASAALPGSITYPTNNMQMNQSALLTMGSYTPIARSIKFTQGMGRAERGDVNSTNGFKGTFLNSRQGILEIVIELETTLGTKNFYDIQKLATTTDAVSFKAGINTGQGEILFSTTNPQVIGTPEADDNGMNTMTIRYLCQSGTDDGDWSLVFKEKNP